jgi:hypothetical protein
MVNAHAFAMRDANANANAKRGADCLAKCGSGQASLVLASRHGVGLAGPHGSWAARRGASVMENYMPGTLYDAFREYLANAVV